MASEPGRQVKCKNLFLAREHFVEQHAQAVDVAAGIPFVLLPVAVGRMIEVWKRSVTARAAKVSCLIIFTYCLLFFDYGEKPGCRRNSNSVCV